LRSYLRCYEDDAVLTKSFNLAKYGKQTNQIINTKH